MPDFSAYRPDLAAPLLDLWNDAVGREYPITPALWWQLTHGDPMFEPADLIVRMGPIGPLGFVLTKVWRGEVYPGCERYQGQGWIALMAVAPQAWRNGIGKQLMVAAHARLRGRGCDRVQLGGSFHHALPGVPDGWDDARAFFRDQGYEDGPLVWDVKRNLADGEPLPEAPPPPGISLRLYRPGEEAALEAFLQREWPGRWARDMAVTLAAGASVEDVMGAFRADDTPVGFAQLALPGSAGAQRWAGFESAMAALGPIGVAADARGGGLGLALLAAGLRHLRAHEAGPTVIDWTDLLAFYARMGFAPWLRYVQGRRSLP